MKKILAIILLALATGASAQKTIHDDMAQVRSVPAFHGIRVQAGIDLYLSEGTEAVAVSARTIEFRDRIRTSVENGILRIWFESNDGKGMVWGNSRNLKAYVSATVIDLLSASGGSDVYVEGTLHSPSLKLDLSGGADFKGSVAVAGALTVQISGGSDADISGTGGSLTVSASGGSDFKGKDLAVDTCTADASGGSDVDVTVNREIRASASGGSDIYYRGSANLVESHKSGGSDVRKRG
ncbi:head GIN domain-containing protein [Flaviaesturariibacter terrae]